MIHIFLGTKAQLIKMAPIMRQLQKRNIEYNFVFSGQHQATINDIQSEFGIKKPDYVLYRGPDITGIFQMLIWSLKVLSHTLRHKEKVWKGDQQGIVLNHGDTFSTLLGALTARISGLKSAHVESGLRSFNIFHPFPEEVTRRAVFQLSSIFYAPGDWAIENLKSYSGEKINTHQNTLRDALSLAQSQIESCSVQIPQQSYGIISIHRFENLFFESRLKKIISIIDHLSQKSHLLFILHKPTEKKLKQYGLLEKLADNPNIELRPRYSYFEFIKLVKQSRFVITDGGSNQEECFYLGKPCLIMRKATERQEGIGLNAVISSYDKDVCEEFIDGLQSRTIPENVIPTSPTDIIIDHLALSTNQ